MAGKKTKGRRATGRGAGGGGASKRRRPTAKAAPRKARGPKAAPSGAIDLLGAWSPSRYSSR